MTTILCDVETVINSQPLIYLSEDPSDFEPSLFIQNIKIVVVPDMDKLDKINLTKRWRYHQLLREQFRKTFRNEFLGLLEPLKRKFVRPIEINDIVFVGQDNLKRSDWQICRVIDIYPGKDNQVRVIIVKTKAGELTRPVKKLYLLELSSLELI
ncbi:DUF5641 domain-containing protein [Nephila pilipes]|uniref:DUF5641 domain-containing protein n=1 Tax=Nephila pilipes TaxID=299642 RepID=A0A8X6I3N9_NEPPI|nr:DUF5641 domain-containing protein [Nephila pilipes]